MISVRGLSWQSGRHRILHELDAAFPPGQCHIILGPNGSGKSTLLRVLSGLLPAYTGSVCYAGRELSSFGPATLARTRGVMSQQAELHFPITVEEVVMMGRYPHFDVHPGKNDFRVCNDIIMQTGLQHLRDRNYLTLSGGEKQRVQFTRMLAQIWDLPEHQQRYVFMDEPLNNLDLKYQQSFLKTIRSITTPSTTVICVLHDINLAAAYADRLHFMKEGRLIRDCPPQEALTPGLIREVFGIEAAVISHPAGGNPLVVPLGDKFS